MSSIWLTFGQCQVIDGVIQTYEFLVRSYSIVQVNAERKQFSISLKQSVTGNHTGPYLASLLKSLELAAHIK